MAARYFQVLPRLPWCLVTGSTIVGAILVSALASYSLARLRFRGNQLIFILCIGGMMPLPAGHADSAV